MSYTLYSDPAPTQELPAYQGPEPGKEKEKETVFRGPQPGQTVFDDTKFVAKKPDTSLARAATQRKMRRLAIGFFLVAAGAAIEYFRYQQEPTIAVGALITLMVFGLLGFFVMRLSRVALLAAIALYGFHTLFLVAFALIEDLGIFFVAQPLIVRCGLLYHLYRSYGMLVDLHELENM